MRYRRFRRAIAMAGIMDDGVRGGDGRVNSRFQTVLLYTRYKSMTGNGKIEGENCNRKI
jgi:hypothetical protein